MKVLVSKIGGVVYFQDAMDGASVVGEMGETEGMLRHLVEAGHDVAFFGPTRGTPPDGVRVVNPDLRGITEDSDEKHLRDNLKPSLEWLKNWGPERYLQMCGYAVTMATSWNPKGINVQAACMRYTAPILVAQVELGLPRLCVNCDPRSYPREQEMVLVWPQIKPAALLSQRTRDWTRTSSGVKIRCREVYAACETWCFRPALPPRERTRDVLVIAHAHIEDGCRHKDRAKAWQNVLNPMNELAGTRGFAIHGKGWEHYPEYDPALMPGPVPVQRVDELLAESVCGPIVAIEEGFASGKLSTYVKQGCVPLLYGRGEPYTYDRDQRFVPYDSEVRVASAVDVVNAARWLRERPGHAAAIIEELAAKLEPDFSVLDAMLEDATPEAVTSETFMRMYGGYR